MQAIDAAFDVIATIHARMSAHEPRSDLARLARASKGDCVKVHPLTASVLLIAKRWRALSGCAFDPQAAGLALARQGRRPGIIHNADNIGSLSGSCIEIDCVQVDGPLILDLGGIAKGFAVDCAVERLREYGVAHGLVNAGGDLRSFGGRLWRIDVRHPDNWTKTRRLFSLREGAVASSVRLPGNEFVQTRRGKHDWSSCTVLARDCTTADVLTKWALQASPSSVQWRAALARVGARTWRA